MVDLLHFAAAIPTVPVQRRMRLDQVVAARGALADRPPWPALFMKAFARVAAVVPELRRAYVKLPWPHLYEYPTSVCSISVSREYQGEQAVFVGRVRDPARLSLAELGRAVRHLAEGPIEEQKDFVRGLRLSGLPRPLRRLAWWLGMNVARQRPRYFGTFGISVYSGLGAESLHPISPLTTTMNYGVIAPDGTVDVRIVYDHRVLDGSTVARALVALEAELTGPVLAELRALAAQAGWAA
jgi:hypothetical protein